MEQWENTMETMVTKRALKIPTSPSRAPRVMVQLSPKTQILLDRMTAASGQPKSSLIAELINAALPAVANALETIKHTKTKQIKKTSRLMSRFAHEATSNLTQQQLQLKQLIDARTITKKKTKRKRSSGRATP
jgi:predicted transcriptional regulator